MTLPFEIDRARNDTPGVAKVIHLNNAGSSLPPRQVTDSIVQYLQREAEIGGYEMFAENEEAVGRYRSGFARLLHAKETEVAFMPNDTLAWSTAFWGLVHTKTISSGATVLVDRATYVSHYVGLLQAVKYVGIEIKVVDSDDTGALDLEALAQALSGNVAMVALTHVGTHRGLVNPVVAAGNVIRSAGDAIYFLDACQSLGQIAVDVRKIQCDVLTGTGRKYLRGPRGTGVLFTSSRILDWIDPPGIDGHSADWLDAATYRLLPDARRFEPFEASMAAKVGFGTALDYLESFGIDAIEARVHELGEHLRSLLSNRSGVELLDGGRVRCGIVTFRETGHLPEDTQARLLAAGVNTSVTQPGSARLDMEQRGVTGAVRASVHYYNTVEELERLADLVAP